MVTPSPKPLRERSNVHHKPMERAARVSDSWMLLAKSTFYQHQGQGPDNIVMYSHNSAVRRGYLHSYTFDLAGRLIMAMKTLITLNAKKHCSLTKS